MNTKLNEEILSMTLNADNRARFIDAILKDAFQKRSDAIRDRFGALLPKLFRRTFGATPQAQAANIKAIAKHRAEAKKLRDKGINAKSGICSESYNLRLIISGQRQYVHNNPRITSALVNFNGEFCSYNEGAQELPQGSDELKLTLEDKLAVEYTSIRDEAEQLNEAADELKAVLRTVLGRCKKLGQAVERWPEFADYAPALLSASREIMVRPEDLSARMEALRTGTAPVKEAMKVVVK